MKLLAFKAWRRVAAVLVLVPLFVVAVQSGISSHAYAGANDAEQNVCINSDPTKGGIFTQVKITVSNASAIKGKLTATYKEPAGTPQAGQEKNLISTGNGKFVTGVGSLAQRPCTSNPGIWVNAGSNANNPQILECTGNGSADFSYSIKVDGKNTSSGSLSLCSAIRQQQLADSGADYTVATSVSIPVNSGGSAQQTGAAAGYFYIQRPSGKYRGIDQQGVKVQVDGKDWTNFSVPINGGPDGGTTDKASVKAGKIIISGLSAGTHDLTIIYSDNGSLDAQGNNDIALQDITYNKKLPVKANSTLAIAGSTAANPILLGSALGQNQAGADPEGDASTGCSFSINPLTWIACPVVGILEEAVRGIDNFITSALTINTDSVFDTSSGYYKAWSSFRVLATAVIIIAGIVMVASQALGFEFLDAYTIRKVLPRLLIAIIGISLSWPIMKFVVEFFNTLGYDIRNLIYSPFGNMGLNTLNAGTLLVANGAILGTLFVMGIGATLSLLLTAALAILIGFLIIIVRDMAIIVLIIIAPVALACYILPNTQKVWKLWSTNFMGLMMMFPIISAFIAVGKVFSAVSLNPQGSDSVAWGSGTVMQIVGFLAYFIPYFLLPIAFRLATGVMGSIAGFVNDRNRGIFDRLKKGRQARVTDRMGRARNNNLWDNNSKVGHWANKAAGWVTDPLDNAAYSGRKIPGFRKRGHRIASSIEHARVEQSGKLFEELNKMGYNDKAFRALSGSLGVRDKDFSEKTWDSLKAAGFDGKAPQSINDLRTVADILKQGSGAEQIAANAIEGSMGRLATLYQDPEMGKANVASAGLMGLAAHGFASSKDLSDAGNALQGPEGKDAAFAQSVVAQAQLLGSRSRPDTKPGYGVMYNSKEKRFVDGIQTEDPEWSRARAVVRSLSSHDLAGAKGGAFDALAPTIKAMLDEDGSEAAAVRDQLFSWAGPYSQASVDVKAKTIDFINTQAAADPKFAEEWRKYQRQEDPLLRRGSGGPEEPPPQSQGLSGPAQR